MTVVLAKPCLDSCPVSRLLAWPLLRIGTFSMHIATVVSQIWHCLRVALAGSLAGGGSGSADSVHPLEPVSPCQGQACSAMQEALQASLLDTAASECTVASDSRIIINSGSSMLDTGGAVLPNKQAACW